MSELHPNYFFSKLNFKNGFFIDVGANDGVTGSMTYDLENLGWKGILVEPNPVLVSNLQKVRKSKIYQNCICDKVGEFSFYIVDGPDNLHGLSRLSITPEFEEHVKKHHGEIKPVTVQTLTINHLINDFFKENEKVEIDFLKIDVEGHELSALQGLDFKKFRPKILCLEDNTKDENKEARKFLENNGYVVIARSGTNNWFADRPYASNFLKDKLIADLKFLKWDLKRIGYRMLGKRFKSQHI